MRLIAGVLVVTALTGGAGPVSAAPPDARPDWAALPNAGDIAQAYPAAALQAGVGGLTSMRCAVSTRGDLSRCTIISEQPAGLGFGAATLGLAPLIKMTPGMKRGQPIDSEVVVPMRWRLPAAPRPDVVPDEELDSAPDWLVRPSGGELKAAWPYEAARKGVSGSATMTCVASAEGGLTGCEVVSEEPVGMGFGEAAVRLAPRFRFKPGIKDGRPVAAEITVPINWKTSGAFGGKRVDFISRPAWAEAPTRAEVAAAHPDKARTLRGASTMNCELTSEGRLAGCRAVTETPRGKGFGRAAETLAPEFRLAVLKLRDGRSVAGSRVSVPVEFDPHGEAPKATMLEAPSWRSAPDAAQVAAVFPDAARKAKVGRGRATVACDVVAGGAVRSCSVEDETPLGLGFGSAALVVAGAFALTPWTEDGKPVDGARVRIPIGFVDPRSASDGTVSDR